jgi:hypothetical protein
LQTLSSSFRRSGSMRIVTTEVFMSYILCGAAFYFHPYTHAIGSIGHDN